MSSVLEILVIEELKIRKNNLLYQLQRIDNELEKREKNKSDLERACAYDNSMDLSNDDQRFLIEIEKTFPEDSSKIILANPSGVFCTLQQHAIPHPGPVLIGATGVFRKLPQPSVSPPEIMRKLPISSEKHKIKKIKIKKKE